MLYLGTYCHILCDYPNPNSIVSRVSVAIVSSLASLLLPLSFLVYSPCCSRVILLKGRSKHATSLLSIIQLFPTIFIMSYNLKSNSGLRNMLVTGISWSQYVDTSEVICSITMQDHFLTPYSIQELFILSLLSFHSLCIHCFLTQVFVWFSWRLLPQTL